MGVPYLLEKIKLNVLIATLVTIMPFSGMADVKPAALFADGMVIQRETEAPVWGAGDAGEKVTVEFAGQTKTAMPDETGKWMVKLDPMPASSEPRAMIISSQISGFKLQVSDVLVGEVWFCSGQSNMEFEMRQLAVRKPKRITPEHEPASHYIKKEIETAKDDLLRQFTVERNTSPLEPLTGLKGSWLNSSPQNNPVFSATAYFFGRELRKELNVPVGLIKCAWGGTRVEPWIPAEAFQQDKEMAEYFESNRSELENKMAKWSPEQAEANYQAAVKRWKARGRGRRPGKKSDPKANQQFPSTLFNAMVNPVIPYAIRGTIWYQGESNADYNTLRYERHFSTMISAWRKKWGQGDFPFYFVQLAPYQGRSRTSYEPPAAKPVEYDGWPSVCDQQRRTLGLKNTGMAVLSDIGEPHNIHPHNKVDVGKRLALWALKNDYKQKVPVCSGPLYKSHQIKGDKVIIKFDSAGFGLMTGSKVRMEATQETKVPLKYFQICGLDRQWKWAQAEITGKDTVTVSHPDVPNPTVVRYAWSTNAKSANLYNKEGLPASIFTTEAEIPAAADALAP